MGWWSISKPAAYAIIVGGLLALAGLGFWRGLSKIDAMVAHAATAAKTERDAHWQAEIAKSNQAVAEARTEQALRSVALQAAVAAADDRARAAEDLLEKRNAELPAGPSCGLDRARGRLLDTDP